MALRTPPARNYTPLFVMGIDQIAPMGFPPFSPCHLIRRMHRSSAHVAQAGRERMRPSAPSRFRVSERLDLRATTVFLPTVASSTLAGCVLKARVALHLRVPVHYGLQSNWRLTCLFVRL